MTSLREELAQSIYTLLAEELGLALLRKPDVEERTKRRAADKLVTVWDDAHLEIDDFSRERILASAAELSDERKAVSELGLV